MTRKCFIIAFAAAFLALGLGQQLQAAHSDRGCNRCHVPHNAGDPDDPTGEIAYGVPLWSNIHLDDADLPVYDLYASHTVDAVMGQPTGASRQCLGCHDGSYKPGGRNMNADYVFSASELAHSHPISFTYDTALATTDGALKDPATALSGLGGTVAADLLDIKGKMQCTSCHDVHTSGIGETMLRYAWDPAARNDHLMCRVCHEK